MGSASPHLGVKAFVVLQPVVQQPETRDVEARGAARKRGHVAPVLEEIVPKGDRKALAAMLV